MASWLHAASKKYKKQTDKHYNIWSEISKTFA
jgi:hypothetical protein